MKLQALPYCNIFPFFARYVLFLLVQNNQHLIRLKFPIIHQKNSF